MATENLAPQIISRLMNEIRDLVRRPAEGIEYINDDDEESVSEIHAIMSGPEGTPYFGGKFRLKLVISADYPNTPPKGYFQTKIYHPNVASNGDICVNTLKRDWTSDVVLKHVFQIIRCLLIVPFPESSLNDEAGKLFMDSYDEFARRARIMTEVHALGDSLSPHHLDSKLLPEEAGELSGSATSSNIVAAPRAETDEMASQKKKAKDAKKKSLKRL